VTAAHSNPGRWIYGFGVGALAIAIRCLNPGYPEGMMLAILLMNAFAPLIDHGVVRSAIRRRAARCQRRRR
jgi:Na+-transporting NADH:ubiquinone oxidoreductase subunit B